MEVVSTLGKILTSNEERDAVHIAILPVTAGRKLYPGQHIGLGKDGRATLGIEGIESFGIVDPMLKLPVFENQRFWLWIYPGKVKSIRHHWTHPLVEESEHVA